MNHKVKKKVTVVHPQEREIDAISGAMTRLAGVSRTLCSADNIHLSIAAIPPLSSSSPHYHINCESAIYVLKGEGRFLTGAGLKEELSIAPGDFIYVPQNAPHAPVNDSEETMELIVARNAPEEIVAEYRIN